jgi:hypothetical protein
MDIPVSLVILVVALGATLVAAVVVPRVIGPTSPWRRRVPGVILLGLGLALFSSQLPLHGGHAQVGVVVLVAWGGVALGLVAARGWARLPGVILAVAGLAVAAWVFGRVNEWANEGLRSADRVLVDIFFLADGPDFSWMEVALDSLLFAVLSGVAVAFLVLPFRRSEPHSIVKPSVLAGHRSPR